MRIIFFGSDPWFSRPVLEALLVAGFEVPLVVTKGNHFVTPKSKIKNQKSKIIQAKSADDISVDRLEAEFNGIATSPPTVTRLRAGTRNDRFTVNDSRFTNDNRPDAIVLASFGPPFLAAEILNWPRYGCLNVHASLLPRWRGASPVFAALAEGDAETGVSIMRMTEEIDRGSILGQKKIKIRTPRFQKGRSLKEYPLRIVPGAVDADDRETLTKRLGKLGGELIVETLKKLETGQITEVRQPEKSPTAYTRRLTKESGRINWSQSPIEIERFIRAVTPWPGAKTNFRFKISDLRFKTGKIKILKAHLERVCDFREFSRFSRKPNQLENNPMLVIDLIQLAGKNPVTWKQFLAGHPEAKLE